MSTSAPRRVGGVGNDLGKDATGRPRPPTAAHEIEPRPGGELQGLRLNDWVVYILRCGDGTLYTGIAKGDASRRLEQHRTGRGAKYTRGRLPLELAACSEPLSRSEALRLEHRTKQLPRASKVASLRKRRKRTRG